MTNAKETIDQLAEAAELLDRGALLRQHNVDALRDGRELDAQAFREQAWLTFREAEVRVQIALGQRIRDQAAALTETAGQMKRMTDELRRDDD